MFVLVFEVLDFCGLSRRAFRPGWFSRSLGAASLSLIDSLGAASLSLIEFLGAASPYLIDPSPQVYPSVVMFICSSTVARN